MYKRVGAESSPFVFRFAGFSLQLGVIWEGSALPGRVDLVGNILAMQHLKRLVEKVDYG